VAEYRARAVGNDGHLVSSRAFVCDSELPYGQSSFVDGHDIELWSGDRLVIRNTSPSNFDRSAEFSRFPDIHGA
jgi:hypothetical protein